MTKQEKMAQELANAFNDQDSIQFYRECALKYSEDFLRKKMQKVMSIPEDQIRKTRGALFTYLIRDHAVVLGISPGTQSTGIAVLHNGRIQHWYIQKFRGPWTIQKRKAIVDFLRQPINRYKVETIAVKIPDALPISDGYIQLLGAMNVLFERQGIKVVYYTLSDLKRFLCPGTKISKVALAECLVAKYPDDDT